MAAKGFARSDLSRQSVLVDNPALPDAIQQRVLADHRSRRLNQRRQDVKGASAEPDRSAVGAQFAAMR